MFIFFSLDFSLSIGSLFNRLDLIDSIVEETLLNKPLNIINYYLNKLKIINLFKN